MNEEIDRKMMCAGEKPEGLPEKPPVEKPIREAPEPPKPATPPKPYPAFEPPEPWPEPGSPKPDKRGQ